MFTSGILNSVSVQGNPGLNENTNEQKEGDQKENDDVSSVFASGVCCNANVTHFKTGTCTRATAILFCLYTCLIFANLL